MASTPPQLPDDLMTIAEAAQRLGRERHVVYYHVKKAKLDKWTRGGKPQVSFKEVEMYFREWDMVRPIDDEEGD